MLVQVSGTALRGFTNLQGRYRIGGVPEGEHDLVAALQGFEPAILSGVPVLANSRAFALDLILEQEAVTNDVPVRGRAELLGEPESGGIVVTFIDEADERTTVQTELDGRFEIAVKVGIYRVRFERSGFVPVELTGVAVLESLVLGLRPAVLVPAPPGDLDGDGVLDVNDDDRDNDGIPDLLDAVPDDPTRGRDTDFDSIPDEEDDDDDGDGLDDDVELDPTRGGGLTDPRNADTDGDGFNDLEDTCPTVANDDQDRSVCVDPTICNDGPPQILALSSTVVRTGGVVTVTGQPLVAPECLGIGAVPAQLAFAGSTGQVVTSTPSSAVIPVIFSGVQAERAAYPVPASAVSGDVRLVQPAYAPEGGAARSIRVEEGGLKILGVLPAVAPPGASVTVVGRAFLSQSGLRLRVVFPDGSAVQVAPERDDRFSVEVPADAPPIVGSLRVELGSESATHPFQISTSEPFIFDIETPLVEPGVGGIRILGANLDQVEQVVFTGTIAPYNVVNSNPAVIDIPVVPLGARPGRIRLRRAGRPDIESQESLSILTVWRSTDQFPSQARAIFRRNLGGAIDVVVFDRGQAQVYRNDPTFGRLTEKNLLFAETLTWVMPRDAHDLAIVATYRNGIRGELYVLDLPRLELVRECGSLRYLSADMQVAFSEDQRYAYTMNDFLNDGTRTLMRIDMAAASDPCTFFDYTRDVCPAQSFSLRHVAGFQDPVVFATTRVGNRDRVSKIRLSFDPPALSCEEHGPDSQRRWRVRTAVGCRSSAVVDEQWYWTRPDGRQRRDFQ